MKKCSAEEGKDGSSSYLASITTMFTNLFAIPHLHSIVIKGNLIFVTHKIQYKYFYVEYVEIMLTSVSYSDDFYVTVKPQNIQKRKLCRNISCLIMWTHTKTQPRKNTWQK